MFRSNAYRRVSLSVVVAGVALSAASLSHAADLITGPVVKAPDEESRLVSELKIAEAELAACNERAKFLEAEIARLSEEVAKLYRQYMMSGDSSIGSELDEIMFRIDTFRVELAETKARASELEKKIADLKAKILKTQKRYK